MRITAMQASLPPVHESDSAGAHGHRRHSRRWSAEIDDRHGRGAAFQPAEQDDAQDDAAGENSGGESNHDHDHDITLLSSGAEGLDPVTLETPALEEAWSDVYHWLQQRRAGQRAFFRAAGYHVPDHDDGRGDQRDDQRQRDQREGDLLDHVDLVV